MSPFSARSNTLQGRNNNTGGRPAAEIRGVAVDAAGDFEFFLNFAGLVVALVAAFGGYVAEGAEEKGEAESLDVGIASEGAGDVVTERKRYEDDNATPDDDKIAVDLLSPDRLNDEGEKAGDDDNSVDPFEGGLGANRRGCEEKA